MSSVGLVKQPALVSRAIRALWVSPQRSGALAAVAIVVGLLVALASLFGKAPPSRSTVPAGYVALVNQKGILMSDWISQVENDEGMPFESTAPATRSKVLRQMIDEELVVQRALVLDLPETTIEVRDILATAVNNQVGAQAVTRLPSEDELRAFFEANRAKYTERGPMTVHDLVLHVGGYQNADQSLEQANRDAAEAVYQLRAGASVDYIREHFGFVPGPEDRGEVTDLYAKTMLGATLYPVALGLRDGEISDPVATGDGVHILIMERHALPSVVDFATARPRVYDDFRIQQSNQAVQAHLAQLRRQAQIVIAPGYSE